MSDNIVRKAAQQAINGEAVRARVTRIQQHADALINMLGPGDSLQHALCILVTLKSMQPADPIAVLSPQDTKMRDAAEAGAAAIIEVCQRVITPVSNNSKIIVP